LEQEEIQRLFDSFEELNSRELKILTQIQNDLESRENPTIKNQTNDDNIFLPFNNYLYISAINNQESRIKNLFTSLRDIVNEYENEGNNVHKGSIFVNFAVVCLRSGDFLISMHYFYKAEYEERSIGNTQFNILNSRFFRDNYWKLLRDNLMKQLQDNQISCFCNFFERNPENDDLDKLILFKMPQYNLQILNFLTKFLQLSHRELKHCDNTPIYPTSTAFLYLVGEIGAVYESILREHLRVPSSTTFHDILVKNLVNTKLGNVSKEIEQIHTSTDLKVTSRGGIVEFNSHVALLITEILRETDKARLLALCLYLLKSIRNNVIHDIAIETPLYGDLELSVKCFLSELMPFWIDQYL
jgi:hypothetical protein